MIRNEKVRGMVEVDATPDVERDVEWLKREMCDHNFGLTRSTGTLTAVCVKCTLSLDVSAIIHHLNNINSTDAFERGVRAGSAATEMAGASCPMKRLTDEEADGIARKYYVNPDITSNFERMINLARAVRDACEGRVQ